MGTSTSTAYYEVVALALTWWLVVWSEINYAHLLWQTISEVPTPTIWSTHLLISVEQAGSLLVGTDFFRLLLLLGPALSDSYSVWPHVSKCAALNFRIVWWSRRKSLLAPSLTSSSLWLKGRVAAWCAVEYTFVLRIGWNILNWLLLTVKLLLKL